MIFPPPVSLLKLSGYIVWQPVETPRRMETPIGASVRYGRIIRCDWGRTTTRRCCSAVQRQSAKTPRWGVSSGDRSAHYLFSLSRQLQTTSVPSAAKNSFRSALRPRIPLANCRLLAKGDYCAGEGVPDSGLQWQNTRWKLAYLLV